MFRFYSKKVIVDIKVLYRRIFFLHCTIMTRQLLIDLSRSRIKESKILFDNNEYNGSYYLAGYSVECALKACLSKTFRASKIPDKKFVNDIYVHDLKALVKHAGMEADRALKEAADVNFAINWAIV